MLKLNINQNQAAFKIDTELFKEIEILMEEEIAATIEDIADKARTGAAKDFGFLANSITSNVNGLDGSVKVGANYAPYIEFGTGGLVDVPEGLESYAMQFKGKGIKQVNLQARPFLFPAFRKGVAEMNERLIKEIDKLNK